MNLTFAQNDFGFGTAYERVAVYRLFDSWMAGRRIESAFEGPVDGMAGVPGIHLLGLARHGVPVTVGLTDAAALENVRRIYERVGVADRLTTRLFAPDEPLPEAQFDLSLVYNAFPLVDDWRGLLERVGRASRRWVLVTVTNPFSYGVGIRKTLRVVESDRKEELFDHPSTQPETIEPELQHIGKIAEHAYFDCPWWPDLFVDAGESLFGATLKRLPGIGAKLAEHRAPAGPDPYSYGAAHFPLFEPDARLRAALARHPVFDWAPPAVARMFGHLHAYLVEK